jgi:hypothetical protein
MGDIYSNRLIAFVDILGFSAEIKNPKRSQEDEERILEVLKLIHSLKVNNYGSTFMNMQEFGVEIITFSDSAVISCPAERDNLFFLLIKLIHLQMELIPFGILLRGAITIGELYHERDIVFGPAMIEAYEMENKVAVYPRIIINENAISQYVEYASDDEDDLQDLENLIKKDKDGIWFIDILRQQEEIDGSFYNYIKWLSSFREIIINGLQNEKLNVRVKYQWLRTYFNEVVLEYPLLLVPQEELSDENIEYRSMLIELKIDDI